jgi:hypothetical protein
MIAVRWRWPPQTIHKSIYLYAQLKPHLLRYWSIKSYLSLAFVKRLFLKHNTYLINGFVSKSVYFGLRTHITFSYILASLCIRST